MIVEIISCVLLGIILGVSAAIIKNHFFKKDDCCCGIDPNGGSRIKTTKQGDSTDNNIINFPKKKVVNE